MHYPAARSSSKTARASEWTHPQRSQGYAGRCSASPPSVVVRSSRIVLSTATVFFVTVEWHFVIAVDGRARWHRAEVVLPELADHAVAERGTGLEGVAVVHAAVDPCRLDLVKHVVRAREGVRRLRDRARCRELHVLPEENLQRSRQRAGRASGC